MRRAHRTCCDQQGAVAILVAITMILLLSFAALAVDLGHLYVVRAELQNAADAAALAGAAKLWPHSGPPVAAPNWVAAEGAAKYPSAPQNGSDGVTLVDYSVTSGYFNLAHSPEGLQGQGITPKTNDAAAVQVIVRRSAGQNGGPVANWFASIFGFANSDVSATATAVSASPGTMAAGALLPMAISKAAADYAFSHGDNTTEVQLGSDYHYPSTQAGQWTSFQTGDNNVPTVIGLIDNGNPTPLSVGDLIWIEPGTKTAIYGSVPIGQDFWLPVVDSPLDTHSEAPIVGFIGFHIDDSQGGSVKAIIGHFVFNIYTGLGGPAGPNYGIYVPPRLAK